MADQITDNQESQLNAFFSDLNMRLRGLEEKQSLLKDRLLLIGENLVSEKEESEKEIYKLKNQLALTQEELKKIKMSLQRLEEMQSDFARKSDLAILKRQFEMFQPLNPVRQEDVTNIVKDILKSERNKNHI